MNRTPTKLTSRPSSRTIQPKCCKLRNLPAARKHKVHRNKETWKTCENILVSIYIIVVTTLDVSCSTPVSANSTNFFVDCVFALSVGVPCCFSQLLPSYIRFCFPFCGFGPPMTSASGPTSHVQTEEACDGSFESWLLWLFSPCLPSPCLFFYVFLNLCFSFSDSLPKWHKISA